MNIYRFIQSKSVREHLKKINYTFSSLETAYIIWQCPDATLIERLDAWQEIIDTMPDYPLPDSMKQNGIESVHEFLRQYMNLQQELLDEFNKKEDGVYFYKFTIVTGLRTGLFDDRAALPGCYQTGENFDNAFSSLSECKKEIQEDIYWTDRVGNKVTTEIIVRRQTLTSHSRVKVSMNERLEILAFVPDFTKNSWEHLESLEFRRSQIMSSFERIHFNIPVPFETGDIVYAELSYPDLISRKKHQLVVVDSILEDKKTKERKCFIYAVDDNSPTGNFSHDEIKNYIELEYYRGRLLGLERFLKAVSSFMKGKLDLEKLIQTWIIISFDHKTEKESKAPVKNRVEIEYRSEDDTAGLTGLKR